MQANRLSSMLFDADPQSSVRFVKHDQFGSLCIQTMNLDRVRYDAAPSNILAEVQGRWLGAIYLRVFERPDGKPYLFLGRHRLLVQSSSGLAQHFRELLDSGKRVRVVEIITLLQEDDAGYTPDAIRELL